MKVTYENGWEHTDIHIDLGIPYNEDYQMRMLSANDIPGLIKVKGSGREDHSRYTYRINGGISMEKKYGVQEMKGEDVERFIEDLLRTIGDVVRHLLDPNRIILSPDMVFIEDGRYSFCYLPASEEVGQLSLCRAFHQMTEYFVKRLDYRDTEGIFLVYLLHKDTMQDGFELRKIIEECRREEKRYRAEKMEQSRLAQQEEKTGMSRDAVFSPDDEYDEDEAYTDREKDYRKTQMDVLREPPAKYGRVRKAVRRIKNGRWGEWNDLITEMDGHGRKGIL